MHNAVKRIGVLTSGGDAPGMNAAIRSVVRTAMHMGIECLGVRRGFNGLITGDIIPMDFVQTSGLIAHGGTTLFTARSEEFRTEEGRRKAAATCKLFGLDGIVGIGGDGTYRGLMEFCNQEGVAVVGMPGTIDNDIACTDYTIGYDTACNTALDSIDKLKDTMQSHERCSVVEVMGRHAGHLALYVGMACGATAVLIPEKEIDFERDVVEPPAWAGAPTSWSSWPRVWAAPTTWPPRLGTPPAWTPASLSWAMCSGAGPPPPGTAWSLHIWAITPSICWPRVSPTGSSPTRTASTWTSISTRPSP